MSFFWPDIRKDIKLWVKKCAHCCAYDIWRNRKSELYFSWPVTTPFHIMHVDLWIPGYLVNEKGQTLKLMNDRCDLTQVGFSTIVKDTILEYLVQLLMEYAVLSFDLAAVVVVDADSKFLHLFQAICIALNIMFWPLSLGNHNGLSVERYHKFLNKTQTIVG